MSRVITIIIGILLIYNNDMYWYGGILIISVILNSLFNKWYGWLIFRN